MIQQLTGGTLIRTSGRASEDDICGYQIVWSNSD